MPDRSSRGAAIVGIGARFPRARDAAEFYANLEAGVDAISEAAPERIDPSLFAGAGIACRRGGFLEPSVAFDAARFGIMPSSVEGAEPDQLLALETAAAALSDAGYDARSFDRDRAEVVLGRGGYLTTGVARLDQRVRGVPQILATLRALGVAEDQIEATKRELERDLPSMSDGSAIGLVPNLAASRIANRLDLRGGAYTIDAACASSLVAVDRAVRDLEDGVVDLALAGGVHLCHDVTFWSVFSSLGALSKQEAIRPFDRRADGLLIGEGVGVVVLKRLADAENDGDRIYAVVRGTGVSSDGRSASLMTPAVEGQVLALVRAWKRAGLDPQGVGLVEAHGTATAAGDAAELATLARVFGAAGSSARAALGSVKSMIGHAMPAAGIAGLIKAALAIHHAKILPSLHCEEPRPELDATRFRVPSRAEPWDSMELRRAGVNAFGFGGVNAHVVLEEHESGRRMRAAVGDGQRSRVPEIEGAFLASADTIEELLAKIDRGENAARDVDAARGGMRVAILNPTPERLTRAKAIVKRGEAWRRDDIWFSPRGVLEDGKVAFLFPGVEATFAPSVDDVERVFGAPMPMPPTFEGLKNQGFGIVAVGRMLDGALRSVGVEPQAIAGHSIGEWTGMIASEMIPKGDVDALVESLAPEALEVPGVVFAAIGASVEKATSAIEGLEDVAISHDNCPHQVLLCGREASVDVALERLSRAGVLAQKLAFRSGYHSPLFADYLTIPRRVLARVPLQQPKTPLWSATICAPYPSDEGEVHRLVIDHLLKPVRFRELVLAMYASGVRAFVQVGTGSLAGFAGDTLRGLPHLSIAANQPGKSGLGQLARVAAAFFVEGRGDPWIRLSERLGVPRRSSPPRAIASERTSGASVRVDLGVPTLRLEAIASPAPLDEASSLAHEMADNLRAIGAAQDAIALAFARRDHAARSGPRALEEKMRISVETHPELVDHTFYRQPEGWPIVADRYPVVPMTMLLEVFMDKARQLVPSRAPIGLEGVRAYRWLAVAPPVEIRIDARFDGEDRVEVRIDGYAEGTVLLGDRFPIAPPPSHSPLKRARSAPTTAERLYLDRWMFHGPRYQGIVEMGSIGDDGIDGTLVGLSAKGGLLDNAGQLLGYWVMINSKIDRLAMPVTIDRILFFEPMPQPGERVGCHVRVEELTDVSVRADVELVRDGRLAARFEGWEDRRFDSDERVWGALTWPEKNTIAVMHDEGFAVVKQPWRAHASRDLLARRYLGERERGVLEKLGPKARGPWLMGRMAIKDAVRAWLWERGHEPIFPIEIEVTNDDTGKPVVKGPFEGTLAVSVAHKETLAVAKVSERDVGIDLEKVEHRGAEFEAVALTDREREAMPSVGASRDLAVTRAWVAKEAAAKAAGLGLQGNPSRFVVRETLADRLLVTFANDRAWVRTATIEDQGATYVVGWTSR